MQTIDTSAYVPSSPDPSGIAYLPAQDRLLVSDSEVNEMPLFQGFNLFTATRTGSGVGSGDVTSYSGEPADLGIDTANGRLFIADDDANRVFIVLAGSDGVYGTSDDTRSNFRTVPFGSDDPEGVAYDPVTGHVFVSDGLGVEIYDVNPVNGVFGDGNDTVTNFDVAQYGAGDCEGLGIDPARNSLLCVDPSTPDNIYELGKDGTLLRILSMAAIPTSRAVVADVTMAPSSNPNDSPATMNYWIVDRHLDNGAFPDENDGLLYEMHLESVPPDTTITSGPSGLTNNASPSFDFSSEPGASFECRIDNGPYAACGSPKSYSSLAQGAHTFEVRAIDQAGNTDPSPASRSFTVDTVAPQSQIDSGPSGYTTDPTPTFSFSSEPGASFECRLDSSQEADFGTCGSPKSYSSLAQGAHTFEVRATDQAGNTDPSPASRSFTVDTVAPQTQIDSGPSGYTNDPTPTFSFSSEPGASFECKIDNGPYAACGSPKTTAHLADGSHNFSVRAVDAAHNTSDPALRSFTVRTAEVKVSGSTLMVTAAAGAKDNFVITRPSASILRVTDFPSGAYTGSGVHTRAGCTRIGSNTADCSASGITLIQVTSADQTDKVTNSTPRRSSLNGGAANDLLTGGSANDTLTGSSGADTFRGMAGNDDLRARDLVSDARIECGAGTADKADLDLLPSDPNSAVIGCETKTRH